MTGSARLGDQRVDLYMPAELVARLDAIASRHGAPRAVVIRRLLDKATAPAQVRPQGVSGDIEFVDGGFMPGGAPSRAPVHL